MEQYLTPIVIGIITAIVTALLTIHIKFASSKEEAYGGLKSIFTNIFIIAALVYTVFTLYSEVTSEEALNRAAVFTIIYYAISTVVILFSIIMIKLLNTLYKVSATSNEIHSQQLELSKNILAMVDSKSNANKPLKQDK